ncbi:unnamed protein product [Ascophyllum nodosum]
MASDSQGNIGWTPPKAPAAPRLISGASPGSRGKLRSEYQARLGGLIVKKRRSGALKFSTTSAEQRSAGMSMQGTGGGRRSNAGGSTPSARGTRQTSLLDFCSGTSSTAPGVLPGQALPPTPSTSAATPLRHLEDQMSEGEEESGVEDMEIAEGDDYESVAPPRTTVPTGVVGSPSTAASPSTPARPATPGRAPPPSPSNSFGLLGGGAVATLAEQGVGGPSPAKAGGGGGGEMGAGGGHHRPAVYSDRFIPARSGSIMESGSPFLAGSPSPPKFAGKGSPSGRRRGAAGVGVRGGGDRRIIGTDRHEIADPGGVRGTEIVAGQGGTGAAGGGGAGGGGTAAAAAGSPEYWPYGSSATDAQREGQTMLNMLLRSELLGADMSTSASARPEQQPGGGVTTEAGRRVTGAGAATSAGTLDATGGTAGALTPSPNVFRFKVPRQAYEEDVKMSYSISPVSLSTRLLSKPSKAKRKIPKIPFKVLDAPQLQDDFYLNLVDWSSLNVLAVGLGACVYLWSACTSKVTKLCDLGSDLVASVAWTQRGTHLAVGTNDGLVQIWDTSKCKKIRTMEGHTSRVGTMSWNAHALASGSRDRLILMRDVRVQEPFTDKLVGHKQEVCGLKWSFDDKQLASGSNDNKLFIWNAHSTSPVLRFSEHTAAVKAIAWSPHQHGILASGGGTADRCIRFWNSQTSARLSSVDTGSQVCNLMWSKNINEIVSTHGYSLNQIIVWRYPSMTKVTTLTGHTMRVLYLAMSPDGQTIVTGAGDETLRFWNAFPGPKSKEGSTSSGLLFPAGNDIR